MSGGWLGPSDPEELDDIAAEAADARWKREREERMILESRLKELPQLCNRLGCEQRPTTKIMNTGALFYLPPMFYCDEHAEAFFDSVTFTLNYLVEDL
jgi:hypothetical protein